MANLHLLGASPADDGSFSGGSWETTLPLANLNDIQPSVLARSTDDDPVNTQFVLDCGRGSSFSMFAFINHNFSSASTIRLRVSDASDGSSPTLDVTVAGRPPDIPSGSLPWGYFPWDGVSNDTQIGGIKFFYQHTVSVLGRYVLVNISDDGNGDGYIEAGRFKAGDAFVPAINMAYGASLTPIDESVQSRSVSGALWSDRKPLRRKFSCQLAWLTETEAMGSIYWLNTQLGITRDLLLVYDPDDDVEVRQRRTIYGHFISLGGIPTANQSVDAPYSTTLEVEDLI
jgi:hypothetical protein